MMVMIKTGIPPPPVVLAPKAVPCIERLLSVVILLPPPVVAAVFAPVPKAPADSERLQPTVIKAMFSPLALLDFVATEGTACFPVLTVMIRPPFAVLVAPKAPLVRPKAARCSQMQQLLLVVMMILPLHAVLDFALSEGTACFEWR